MNYLEKLKGLMKISSCRPGLHADDAETTAEFLLGLMREATILTVW